MSIFLVFTELYNYMSKIYFLKTGMIGHALVISSLHVHQGKLDDELCDKIWPLIREMFAPWFVPYSMQNLKENMASWIQQLADDRTVLLPWIPADGNFAQKVIDMFYECVQFLVLTLPACNNILSHLWQWYVTSFAHPSIKDHILYPIHKTFLSLNWQSFWPNINDLDLMLRVVDQYLPECHLFLGHIFMNISWGTWLSNFINSPPELKQKVYQCFFNLLVKLSTEPNVANRYAENAKSLLLHAENFEWNILEPNVFQHVMDWYVLSCDASVIFKYDPLNLDYRLLHFLKVVGGWKKNASTNNTDLIKRTIYIRGFIKLLAVYSSKNNASVVVKESDLGSVILRLLNKMDEIVQNEDEVPIILEEVLHILNIGTINKVSYKFFIQWIKSNFRNTKITTSILKRAGFSINEIWILGNIMEVTIASYFESSESTWEYVVENLNIFTPKQTEFEDTLIENNCLLTLYAMFRQKIIKGGSPEILIKEALNWLTYIKISEETESKIYLMWSAILYLSIQTCNKDVITSAVILNKFSQVLIQTAEDKTTMSWGRGLLSVIGINKQGISLNFRFMCKAMSAYILAQLPETKGEARIVRTAENAPCTVGQPGGNTDCVKLLLTLDFGQSQGPIKECAELALQKIQDPKNSLHNVNQFLSFLTRQFYLEAYLQDMSY